MPSSIDIVWFVLRREGKEVPVPQALRFPRSRWTEAAARKWIKDNQISGTFEPASGEGGANAKAECPDCGEVVLVAKGEKAADYLCPTCEAQMRARTIKTGSFETNIFRTGWWEVNGKQMKFDIPFLDKVISNFKAGYLEPYLKITADGTHAPQPPILRNLSFGWVEDLWRVGERLYARFKDVPMDVIKMIKGGLLKKKSVEIPLHHPTGDGIDRGPCLKACMFFGTGIPKVHGLEDLVTVFAEGDKDGEILPADTEEKPIVTPSKSGDSDPPREPPAEP
ncbi:MAG: hypothetical protein ACYTKD_31745, partial [Planctomycetota bacterium]